MKQVFCKQFSSNIENNIEVDDVPIPTIANDEVLIKMLAAPINPTDLLLITNRHIFEPKLPSPVGMEAVGKIIEKGKDVSGVNIGDIVALPYGGNWSEYVNKKESDFFVLPDDLDIIQASMFSINPFTAIGLLEGLKDGDWLLQNAANSAIGQMIISIAAKKGINTINIVRKESYARALYDLGANCVIDNDEALQQQIKEATGGKLVNRALDAIAGNATGKLYDCITDNGELWCYGLLASDDIILPATKIVFGNVVIKGYSRLKIFRNRTKEEIKLLVDEISSYIRDGVISTPVQQVFPITEAKQAVKLANEEGRQGKIVFTFD
jgi:NADPH:quinone reductase-like Zn-dependent oxidoreductase